MGNSIRSYLAAAVTFALALGVSYAARRLAVSRLAAWASRTQTDIDDFLVHLLSSIKHPEFAFLALYAASRGLHLHAAVARASRFAFVVWLSVRGVLVAQAAAAYVLNKYAQDEPADLATRSAMTNVRWLVNAVLWALGGLLILDNLGIDVTALVAGLGIGGVAVALAAQAILGDLFSSFAIFMDEPFKVGDFIIVGDLLGTVEHIGIKTTRVRSLHGEMLVFANSDLTSSRIRNFGLMQRRRVVFQFGVVYQTPVEKLRNIPAIVQGILAGIDRATIDRVHFKGFGASSLDYEVVYFVESSDYNLYMDEQQRMNLELVEAFQAEGIDFAYPTQTLFIEKAPSSPARDAAPA
ncbi:MAG: mechanosensitive ion channel family protein [Elusimicrobia bacterium]|nr:mechanosensitive ion channel family protein [Elusimicrobiota bacterium]